MYSQGLDTGCLKTGNSLTQLNVMHRVASGSELLGKMPHRREQQHQFVSIMANVGRLLPNLGYQYGVSVRVRRQERGIVQAELIGEHQNKGVMRHASGYDTSPGMDHRNRLLQALRKSRSATCPALKWI